MPGPTRAPRPRRPGAPATGGAGRSGWLAALLLAASLLGGCRTIQVKPEAAEVRLHFDLEAVRGCASLGEVVGSEGHWYTYLFLANEAMTTAAMNDLRNKAQARGADAVYVTGHTLLFTTSVTILGQAYRCGR